ncbi:uncharacterized protein LOC128883007 isoform X1 [Hylaeus volcanicus]|uniref:uncharacterized protein LOC128883007 isoform X1 n=1 Tax=Hylaeus volcanicus TaxID=313075 RepID=UPI0023B79B0F|nr:uncharacterized protein LOC128883007 isoform X1 [Hylaeus volcanicus]XP_053990924.1 uncharacterized protein LOC128883007 isoform X1 [Hylaeus volcanicus]XP_053990925.1 uncharacterized protein LOC128883007 isoform X1 [Hylaeus volcanicus]XP_053990926.1 uncharacterized protein LOC128883007 isoform X1 [Hylaeus volcanicus]
MDFLSCRSLDTNILQTLLLENIHKIPFSDVLFVKMCCLTDIICQVDCIVFSSANTKTTTALSLLFTHLFCRIPKRHSAADQRRLLASLQPYAFTLSCRSDIILKKKQLIQNSFINNSLACLRSRLKSTGFTKEILFFLILLITPSCLFNENELGWRQYHKLSIRPSAGIPLEGVLREPLNRFHHFLEILLCYSLTFSKSISHEFVIPPVIFTPKNTDTAKLFGILSNHSDNIFYFDPPLHTFFQSYARNFLTTVTPGRKSLTFSKLESTTSHTSTNLSQTVYNFLDTNTRFTGYDYINLQLTRAHCDLLRKELTFLGETGVLPQPVPKLPTTLIQNAIPNAHSACIQKKSVAIIPFENILIDINERQKRRLKYELTSWRFNLPQPLVLPQHLEKKHYCELFDADFRCNKSFFYTYDHGDAKAVQYYPTLRDILNPEYI